MATMSEQERSERFEAQRQRIREQYLRPADGRSASSARGLHHTALVSSDVEQTVRFYQDLLEFPLTELIENRDYPGSSHFFSTSAMTTCWRSSTFPASIGSLPGGPRRAAPPRDQRGALALGAVAGQARRGRH